MSPLGELLRVAASHALIERLDGRKVFLVVAGGMKEGFHAYCDSNGMFDAEIKDIEENGRLLLRDRNGRLRGYFFKEVKFIINNKQT